MKVKKQIYDFLTKTYEIIEEEVEELEDIPIEIEHSLEEKIEEIKEVNNTQDELIDTSMLATDELYTMIEPILASIPQTVSLEGGVSRMVELYVAMIQRGLKTIDKVPERYREEVRKILEEVEK